MSLSPITAPYEFTAGTSPLLISIPHAGTRLTPEVAEGLSEAAQPLGDTDWHIPRLYNFARALGASVLVGNYSRFVIDLNRPSDDKPLYTTATTGLYPDTLFDGRDTFKPGKIPTDARRQDYLAQIWQPYHQRIQSELARIKQRFGYALLFDAHSIASVIPRLFDGQLPDLNLGTNKTLPRFTVIGATTREGMLPSPLRARFGFTAHLDFYPHEELEKLIERSASVLGVNLDEGSAHELALRSRGTPRIANRLLRRVRDWAIVHDLIVVHPADVKEALALYQIDSEGLDRLDIAVLNAIVRNFNGGPVGLNNLAAMVGEESETVETVCEPYLVREGFMVRTPKGRVATEKAWQHLGITPKDDVSKLF